MEIHIIGKAVRGEFFGFAQHRTVGSNKGVYPKIGDNVRVIPCFQR